MVTKFLEGDATYDCVCLSLWQIMTNTFTFWLVSSDCQKTTGDLQARVRPRKSAR